MASANHEPLFEFISAAKAQGAADDFVVSLLRQNGWSERRIYAAFTSYYERTTGLTLPERGARVEYASDAFVYLLALVSLGFWAFAVGSIFYNLIDQWFPSVLDVSYSRTEIRERVSWQLATVIVAFPVFALVSRNIVAGLRRAPERAESGVRKWLIYVALIATATTLVGDGIALLNAFLRGDLSLRFLLQTAVILTIAGGIFSYYLLSVRSVAVSQARERGFAAFATTAAVAALAFGFGIAGSPSFQGDIAADRARIDRLSSIDDAIADYKRRTHATRPPRTLGALGDAIDVRDPITKAPIGYRPLGATGYQLCATFARADAVADGHTYTDLLDRERRYLHGTGITCYSILYSTN